MAVFFGSPEGEGLGYNPQLWFLLNLYITNTKTLFYNIYPGSLPKFNQNMENISFWASCMFLLLAMPCLVAQENKPNEIKEIEPGLFRVVENVPSFPDGQAALLRYMAQNLELPKWFRDSTIEGTVIVQFIIEPDGSFHDIKVVKSLQAEIDACCVKLVQQMPKWQPGRSRGRQRPYLYNLPIRIRLE